MSCHGSHGAQTSTDGNFKNLFQKKQKDLQGDLDASLEMIPKW